MNGKVRDIVEVPADVAQDAAKELALNSEKIKKILQGKTPRRVVYVKGKLVNIVL